MKISEVISYWQQQLACVGDQELYKIAHEDVPFIVEYKPRIKHTKEWPLKARKWVVK